MHFLLMSPTFQRPEARRKGKGRLAYQAYCQDGDGGVQNSQPNLSLPNQHDFKSSSSIKYTSNLLLTFQISSV